MESVLAPPPPFNFDENMLNMASGNLCHNWEKWKNGFEIYSKACELSKKTPEIQLNILLHVIGEQCREIVDQLCEKKLTAVGEVLTVLDAHFKIKKNVTVERHRFFTRNQEEYESIDQYVFVLRKLSQSCDFGNLNDGLIKDRLVCGVASAAIRERLLREDDLTLSKALEICRAAIVSRMYSDKIKQSNVDEINVETHLDSEVNIIRRKGGQSGRISRERSIDQRSGGAGPVWRGRGRGMARGGGAARGRSGPAHRGRWDARAPAGGCGRCGGQHRRYDCPAYGKTCTRCSRMNHFARVCGVYMVEESDEQDSEASG